MTTPIDYPLHPFCEIIPEMGADELEELTESIKLLGLQDPIVLYDGQILDGRSREFGCKAAGVQPRYVSFASICPAVNKVSTKEEKDKIALDWVISHNVHRRHLDASQRAMVAAKLATFNVGNPHRTEDTAGVTQKEAADKMGVSTVLVSQAAQVMKHDPEKAKEVEAGKKTVSKAAAELKEQKQMAPETKLSPFAQAVADGVHTGKKFRKKIGELTKLVDQCVITVPLVEYLGVCVAIESLTHVIDGCKNMPKMIPVKDMEKRLASLQAEKQDLHTEIGEVIVFGHNTYPQWIATLKKEAATDEEKALVQTVEYHFEQIWEGVQSDLNQSKSVHFEILEVSTKQVTANVYMDSLDITALVVNS